MFPEYRDLITTLKTTDNHFLKKFNEHNQLDAEITELEKHSSSDATPELKLMKTKRLHLKEQIFEMLKSHQE
ncbi:DUF465 domain-containing protein [Shewanella sp. SR43-4]|jgi:uncharacterized protein YdcH (DUF465 family)|nr:MULTISPECIES: DUF465 domain-containing protein [Shewanella]NCQ45309.1 DUF465 domain-containing protein [Shewanella frigidimarina]MBB1316245.1 DUF465 domain-containing protein [Shewanella sp. SR43-4]MBB1388995.1 DUF465 domain-containing protein [Shewanella sp. SG44-6]MBB1475385.1 DUF465 domain-containing protein [Shewanella sp. SG41-3]NCO70703.1 DUF465 domain-containing protein [Shewanella vesiculosa]|tara:strand:- start:1105 stop:1320 length:216 start_codon:yes stop_codon:yes gene_type:complete